MYIKRLLPLMVISNFLVPSLISLPSYGQNKYLTQQEIVKRSCQGIGTKITKSELINLAKTFNVGKPDLARSFEIFARSSILDPTGVPLQGNTQKFESKKRLDQTTKARKDQIKRRRERGENPDKPPVIAIQRNVIPDSVLPLTLEIQDIVIVNGVPVPRLRDISSYPRSTFIEFKTINKNTYINLAFDDYQPLGMIDYLATSSEAAKKRRQISTKSAEPRPTPRLVYVTVADTIISSGLLDEASKKGIKVGVFQAIVCRVDPNRNLLRVGNFVPLNPMVYGDTKTVPLNLFVTLNNDLL